MSGVPPPPPPDPSMEDILASIRRILDEDPAAQSGEPGEPAEELVLDETMLAEPPAPPAPPPAPVAVVPPPERQPSPPIALAPEPDSLLNPAAVDSAAIAMQGLARHIAAERSAGVYRGGPTLEDIVREEMRPILKAWLDSNLPPLVERLVRAEIERVSRAAV